MIDTVFFDLFNTLVRYEPSREELQAQALGEFGIKVSPESLRWPLAAADEYIYAEIARSSLGERSDEERMKIWAGYETRLLQEAGIEADQQLIAHLLTRMKDFNGEMVLYGDVLPALIELKGNGVRLGLISNIDQDIVPLFDKLGLSPLLEVVVTSQNAGHNKPHPEIFRTALRRAGAAAAESAYVGDQYQVDVVGARNAGMTGMLLDRNGFYPEITDCPRLQNLGQVADYL